MTEAAQGTRRLGSAALDLCFVACGWLDGYWERALHPWDLVAGAADVPAREGGRPTSMGGPSTVKPAASSPATVTCTSR